jgi:hypothetical protein
MSTEQPQPDPGENTERLPSLAGLQALHKDLLQARRQDGDNDELFDHIEDLIRRGQPIGALLDSDEDRGTAQAILDYWSTILFKADRQPPDATLAEFDPALAPEIPDALCPYVGLDPFREAKRDVFFGRERMVTSLLERMRDDRLLVVVGPSGCGKSSIVLAGLLPALKNGALPDSQNWRYAPRMVPGSKPLTNLVRVMSAMLAEEISDPVAWAREQEDLLRQNPQHLAELADSLSATPVVDIVDQFEEVFTLCSDDETRRAFLDNLANLVGALGTAHRVILTMRTDFEPFVTRFPEFQALFEPAIFRVTPLTAAELRDAIERPAQKVGLKFEAGLIDQLLHDVLGEPAALPLLQFTLLKLWDHRMRNRIAWQAYNRLGGGRLALARSADSFYDHLIPEDQATARRVFLRLVRPGEGLEFTSNRVRVRALYQAGEALDRVQRVVDKLIAARLVRITEGDIAADVQIEVAHEALVRNWPRLVDWLEEERHAVRQRQIVANAAERWNASGRDLGALYTTETLLEEALRVVENSGIPLNEQETEFIQASRHIQEKARQAKEKAHRRELEQANKLAVAEKQRADEQTKAAKRLWWLVGALLVLVVGAIVAVVIIQGQRAIAISAQNTAEAGATQVAAAKSTVEAGATQVAANLKVAQDSLDAQVGLIDRVATADAEKVALVVQIQTLAPAPSQTLLPTRTPRATLSLPIYVLPMSAFQSARATRVARSTATPPATPSGAIAPIDIGATATAAALALQREQVLATQTAVARPLNMTQTPIPGVYAIVNWVPITLRAQPGDNMPAVAIVLPPSTLRVIDTSKNPWFLVESLSGDKGYVDGRWVVYEGDASLLPKEFRLRVITNRPELPFVHGQVVSHDNVQTQYPLFQQPNSSSKSIATLPVGYELIVLAVTPGDSAYGSGQWYIVTLPDPGGQNIRYTGFLPVEVVAQRTEGSAQ